MRKLVVIFLLCTIFSCQRKVVYESPKEIKEYPATLTIINEPSFTYGVVYSIKYKGHEYIAIKHGNSISMVEVKE